MSDKGLENIVCGAVVIVMMLGFFAMIVLVNRSNKFAEVRLEEIRLERLRIQREEDNDDA